MLLCHTYRHLAKIIIFLEREAQRERDLNTSKFCLLLFNNFETVNVVCFSSPEFCHAFYCIFLYGVMFPSAKKAFIKMILYLCRREWSCNVFVKWFDVCFLQIVFFHLRIFWNLISLSFIKEFLIFCSNSWEKVACLCKMIKSTGLKCLIKKRKQILCYFILSSYFTAC